MTDIGEWAYDLYHDGVKARIAGLSKKYMPDGLDSYQQEIWTDGWKEGATRDDYYQHQNEFHF